MPTAASAAFGALGALRRGHAGINQRQLDVVQRGGARQQIEGLKNKSDFFIANARQFVVVQFADQLLVQPILPFEGESRQPIKFISVDLPDPDGPMMATYSLR